MVLAVTYESNTRLGRGLVEGLQRLDRGRTRGQPAGEYGRALRAGRSDGVAERVGSRAREAEEQPHLFTEQGRAAEILSGHNF